MLFLVAVTPVFIFMFKGNYMSKSALLQSGVSGPIDVASEIEHWKERADIAGSASAYREFVGDNIKADFDVQHLRAHIIGEALYAGEGIDGIKTCDSSFGFGCFHGLFGVGFVDEGEAFIKKADTICVEQFGPLGTGCQHGIGHGILEYTGHQRLNDALSLCKHTTQIRPLLGCTSGVFMEYNTPLVLLPDNTQDQPKPFDEDKPYGPCDFVVSEFQISCYFELAPWWHQMLDKDIARMGALCADIQTSSLRIACSLGIGNIIGTTSNYEIITSKQLCNQTPSDIQTFCRAGAAWSMFANPEHSHKAPQMCADLSSVERETCNAYTDLSSVTEL
jgi:hypothetical protein